MGRRPPVRRSLSGIVRTLSVVSIRDCHGLWFAPFSICVSAGIAGINQQSRRREGKEGSSWDERLSGRISTFGSDARYQAQNAAVQ
jgi:hypothetical protein